MLRLLRKFSVDLKLCGKTYSVLSCSERVLSASLLRHLCNIEIKLSVQETYVSLPNT